MSGHTADQPDGQPVQVDCDVALQRIDQALTEVRGELVRVDSKASTLLTVAGIAFTVVLAAAGRTDLPLMVVGAIGFTAGILGCSIVALLLAVIPRLGITRGLPTVGFPRYAVLRNHEDRLLYALARTDRVEWATGRATELTILSQSLVWKYRMVRLGTGLLIIAVVNSVVAAVRVAAG